MSRQYSRLLTAARHISMNDIIISSYITQLNGTLTFKVKILLRKS
jgi:hypothetical protein